MHLWLPGIMHQGNHGSSQTVTQLILQNARRPAAPAKLRPDIQGSAEAHMPKESATVGKQDTQAAAHTRPSQVAGQLVATDGFMVPHVSPVTGSVGPLLSPLAISDCII